MRVSATCFGQSFCPSSGAIDCVLQLWYNATTMLPAGHRLAISWVHYTTSCNTQSSAPEDGKNNCPKHVELTGIINKPLLLHLVGCLYYLNQRCTVKQISDNEIYLLIKYIKSVLWRVAKRLSYIEDARYLKVNTSVVVISSVKFVLAQVASDLFGDPYTFCFLLVHVPHTNTSVHPTQFRIRYSAVIILKISCVHIVFTSISVVRVL